MSYKKSPEKVEYILLNIFMSLLARHTVYAMKLTLEIGSDKKKSAKELLVLSSLYCVVAAEV